MIWKAKTSEIDLTSRALVMGILNVTLDSFSDGGKFADKARALEHARAMEAAGAQIIDIGGESTRPGADPVSTEKEINRVVPVIEALQGATGCWISVDTMKPEVAQAALRAGAHIVNDVSGLRDPEMVEVVRQSGAGAVVMHMLGTPKTMQQNPVYDDVVESVACFFQERLEALSLAGIDPACLAFDPGIGFGKTAAHNLSLIRGLGRLGNAVAGRPILLGVSRKAFIGKILGRDTPADRDAGTAAISAYARQKGARILRVHDVRANSDAVRMTEAILGVPIEEKYARVERND